MARLRRQEVVDAAEVGVYHCINRCVRRAFLCGNDPVSGQCFDHRKDWIQQRLEFLASQFGIDVLGFAVMSNHLHVVLRNRPDLVAGWSDEEVARRWWMIFPQRRTPDGSPADPEPHELQMLTADASRLAELRLRLSSLSWFMRCLAEPIARRANREDQATGRFFEGRYKCVPLLDETALAACLAYVDLNPIRAGIAQTPETSEFTSGYERIQGLHEAQPTTSPRAQHANDGGPARETRRGDWLSPLELAKDLESQTGPVPGCRASNLGCLPMSLADYLSLLDWTGRQLHAGKPGTIPSHLGPILQRLSTSGEGWLKLVEKFGRLFRSAAGTPASLAREAHRRGRRWVQGISQSRAMFG